MAQKITAVAEGPGGLFATADAGGRVSVWSRPGELASEFDTDLAAVTAAVPSERLAIASPRDDELQIVVGSWTRGLAAFRLDGKPLWQRRDIRHVQQVRALPTGRDGQSLVGAVVERGPGLVLGPTGGTRYSIVGARFLAGGADGSLLVHDRREVALRPAPDREPAWRLGLDTFAVLDAVVDGEALICTADGRPRLIGADGVQRWRTPAVASRRIVRAHSDPGGAGWLCLAFASGGRAAPPQVLRVTRDGNLAPIRELAGSWITFVDGGRYLVAQDGNCAAVVEDTPAS